MSKPLWFYHRSARGPLQPDIPWDTLDWIDTGDPEHPPCSRMLASFSVAGYPFHLEAYAVKRDADDILRTIAWPDDMDLVYRGLTGEGEWRTLEIEGREYILIAQPYGS